jgi:hypothetical protein
MNEPTTHARDAAMATRQQTQNRQQTQAGLVWVVVAVATLFILPEYLTPPYDVMFMSFGSAALLTVFLCLHPESFRSRSGSLVPAFFLVAALWLLAVVSTVLSLIG